MSAPLTWVKRITSTIAESNTIPLFGNAPPFNWEQLSSTLAARFGLSSLKIHPKEQTWRAEGEWKFGMGKQTLVYPITISPLGTVFWILPHDDMIRITSWILNPESPSKPSTAEILQEGFYRYLLLEVVSAAQLIEPLKELTLHLDEEHSIPDTQAFCIDVEIKGEHHTCWGRLAIPAEFRTAWVHHFESSQSDYIPNELARQLPLSMGVRTGSVLLRREEWDELNVGDFVVLDRGSYNPRNQNGSALLMLGSTPLFNIKIKHNKIELIDYALYYEENMQQKASGSTPEHNPETKGSEGEAIAIKELPLYITVEIARIKMTLDQLMHLTPGNTLELPIHPEQSVSLTVNGEKVGRAELVYLGDTLGLRILQIG